MESQNLHVTQSPKRFLFGDMYVFLFNEEKSLGLRVRAAGGPQRTGTLHVVLHSAGAPMEKREACG